jgi:hypothetical protein
MFKREDDDSTTVAIFVETLTLSGIHALASAKSFHSAGRNSMPASCSSYGFSFSSNSDLIKQHSNPKADTQEELPIHINKTSHENNLKINNHGVLINTSNSSALVSITCLPT